MPNHVLPNHNPNEGRIIFNAGFDELTSWFALATGSTRVQGGTNIFTGGTGNSPTINLTAATLSFLSATTISGGTILSGRTNLYDIFVSTDTNDVSRIQPGFNVYTGGTGNAQTVNISAATLVTMSGGTVSGGTFYSAGTNLYNIFIPVGGSGSVVIPGTNIITGGSQAALNITISASPIFNVVSASGNSVFTSKLNVSGDTSLASHLLVSGSTHTLGSLTTQAFTGSTIRGTNMAGADSRIVEASTTGDLTATKTLIDAWTIPVTAQTALSLTSNWNASGSYTGTGINLTYQGQMYYDGDYFFMAVADNTFIRLIRG